MTFKRSPSVVAGITALLLLLGIGAFLIHLYISKERQRDLQQWESRLGLVADTRVDAIERWLETQLDQLEETAGNASLQLYLWQLSQREDTASRIAEPAQQTYLRNLILATAERYGFSDPDQPRIPASLPQHRATGLALLDQHAAPVVLTPGMPEISRSFLQTAEQVLETGVRQVSEIRLDNQDRPVLAFALPVKRVLGAGSDRAARPVGVLLGIRNAEQDLFPLLERGVSFAENSEALLVRIRDRYLEFLSPTTDGGKPLRRSLALDREDLASIYAITHPGDFGVHYNYQGQPVLSVARNIDNVPWVLVQQVDASQALQESNRRLTFLLTVLSLILLSVAALVVAAWRHGSSVRAKHQADELREKALKLQRQTELLHAIADNIDAHTLLLSNQGEVLFSNQPVADAVGAQITDLIGKSLTSVLGPIAARELAQEIQTAKETGKQTRRTLQLQYGDQSGFYQASIVPIERVGEHQRPLLVVLDNITQLQSAQNKHARLLRNLVSTLVHIVDLHDPYSAHHSSRMAEVANLIGRELRLSPAERQTLDLAATLGNLGKIMIPKEVLTKTGPLTDAEHELLQKHVQYGLELLENLQFEGPVLDTISQKQELLDGSGYPKGLSGEQMSRTGKILSVANAFVALVSPRAYREGLSIEAALDQLMNEAGSRYDRQVVAALFHIAENRKDWSEWNGRVDDTPD